MSISPIRARCSEVDRRAGERSRQGRRVFNLRSRTRCDDHARRVRPRLYPVADSRPGGGSAIRTVMAIAERMPDVGKRFYEAKCWRMRSACRGLSRCPHGVQNELEIKDTELAAAQFMMSCQATLFQPFIFARPSRLPRARGDRQGRRQRGADVPCRPTHLTSRSIRSRRSPVIGRCTRRLLGRARRSGRSRRRSHCCCGRHRIATCARAAISSPDTAAGWQITRPLGRGASGPRECDRSDRRWSPAPARC